VLAGPDHGAPAFRLAAEVGSCDGKVFVLILKKNQGYDVWLGNYRGNHDSRQGLQDLRKHTLNMKKVAPKNNIAFKTCMICIQYFNTFQHFCLTLQHFT